MDKFRETVKQEFKNVFLKKLAAAKIAEQVVAAKKK